MTTSTAPRIITIDLLRHGEPEGGEVLRGRIDHALTELGWQQMREAVARTRGSDAVTDWTHVVSSPLKRCSAFAHSIAQERGVALCIESCWQEIDYGDWDGMPLPDWREQAAAMFREFRADISRLEPPNGESFVTFSDRVLKAWQELSELPDDSHVLLVTHGGVLRVILPTVLGMPLNRSQPLHIPFASYSRIRLEVYASRTQSSLVFHYTAD